jgi:hypothetical protein
LPDGKRLDECFADLVGALVGPSPGSFDRWAWRARDGDVYRQAKVLTRQQVLGTEIGDFIIHREAMRIIAEHAIREELRSGRLAIWAMSDKGRVKMDHRGSLLIDRHTLIAGEIHPSKNPPSGLKDRPLWILLADWQNFRSQFLSSREGVSQTAAAPVMPKAGRPNQSNKAIDLHEERLRRGIALESRTAEAKAIVDELRQRHASDVPPWNCEVESVKRVLRRHCSKKSSK